MPTFKNNMDKEITYEVGGQMYSFASGKNTPTRIWIPYKDLGLELVDENYPPVQSKVLISGTFKFGANTERKTNVSHCEKYNLKVILKSGGLMMYTGSSYIGAEITSDYETNLEWSYAPYLRFKGLEAGTEAKIYAEVKEP